MSVTQATPFAPGVYAGVPDSDYHAGPELSSSGARRLLPPSCPALFRYWADNPEPPKLEYDIGRAAHRVELGAGPELVVVDFPDWRKADARAARDAAYAAGKTPLLRRQHDEVLAMVAALRAHPLAAALLDPDEGQPEASAYWTDEQTGVACRCRFDWLRRRGTGRVAVVDYKTSKSAQPGSFARSAWDFGYFGQAAWYLDACAALDLADPDAAFRFVVQEREAPYLVTVFEPDQVALRIARERNRMAIEVFAECTATGRWPGYSADVVSLGVPGWVARGWLEDAL